MRTMPRQQRPLDRGRNPEILPHEELLSRYKKLQAKYDGMVSLAWILVITMALLVLAAQ